MEDSSHHPRIFGHNNRIRGKEGRNTSPRNRISQEMKNEPGKNITKKQRVDEDRDPKWEEG
jgi:hypothetical protein